jgi:hypothetical protein
VLVNSVPTTVDLRAEKPSSVEVAADRVPLPTLNPVPSSSTHTVSASTSSSLDVSLPVWTAIDSSSFSVVELRTADGSPAPAWLHLDPTTGSLQGTPPEGFQGTVQLQLVVTDRNGEHVVHIVQLHFDNPAPRSEASAPQKPTAQEMPAKPGLDAQFSRHARSAPISAQAAQALRSLHARDSDRVSTI